MGSYWEVMAKTKEEIREIVRGIIAEIAPDEDVSTLKAEIPLREQLDLDSMDFLDIVMELRKQHSVDVPEADYPRLESLDSCADYLVGKI
ncbi:MAG: acyl carrier protein [Puniceicoccales bacterium]|jgi:acyl carrier protein|nr:acyl carrier protein [Puniceicoccales bacterium]